MWRRVILIIIWILTITLLFLNLFFSIFNWNLFFKILFFSNLTVFVTACWAVYYAYKTWNLERKPIVHAIGTFIITTTELVDLEPPIDLGNEQIKNKRNVRDYFIDKENSPHTLQIINVGRGPAQNIVICASPEKKNNNKVLESINADSYSLPSNKGTKEFGEILRVHGQIFGRKESVLVGRHEVPLESESSTIKYFNILFEDYKRKEYLTKVKIELVSQVDDENLKRVMDNNETIEQEAKDRKGIEVWKVMENQNL